MPRILQCFLHLKIPTINGQNETYNQQRVKKSKTKTKNNNNKNNKRSNNNNK